MTINRKELKYLVVAVISALALFTYIIPKLLEKGFGDSSPYLQFLIFFIGIFVFLQIFLKAVTLGNKINIPGSVGVILLYISLDILIPPMMISTSGELLSGPLLFQSAPDYIAGLIALQLGLTGFLVYLFTYIIVPFLLLLAAAKLIPNFVRRI